MRTNKQKIFSEYKKIWELTIRITCNGRVNLSDDGKKKHERIQVKQQQKDRKKLKRRKPKRWETWPKKPLRRDRRCSLCAVSLAVRCGSRHDCERGRRKKERKKVSKKERRDVFSPARKNILHWRSQSNHVIETGHDAVSEPSLSCLFAGVFCRHREIHIPITADFAWSAVTAQEKRIFPASEKREEETFYRVYYLYWRR